MNTPKQKIINIIIDIVFVSGFFCTLTANAQASRKIQPDHTYYWNKTQKWNELKHDYDYSFVNMNGNLLAVKNKYEYDSNVSYILSDAWLNIYKYRRWRR